MRETAYFKKTDPTSFLTLNIVAKTVFRYLIKKKLKIIFDENT